MLRIFRRSSRRVLAQEITAFTPNASLAHRDRVQVHMGRPSPRTQLILLMSEDEARNLASQLLKQANKIRDHTR